MGIQTRTRNEGCGVTCNKVTDSRSCELPYTEPQVTLTAWKEVYCALVIYTLN